MIVGYRYQTKLEYIYIYIWSFQQAYFNPANDSFFMSETETSSYEFRFDMMWYHKQTKVT